MAIAARDVMRPNPDRVPHTDTLHEVPAGCGTCWWRSAVVCRHRDLCGIIADRHIGWRCDADGGDRAAASLTEEPPVTIGVELGETSPGGTTRWTTSGSDGPSSGCGLLPVLDGRRRWESSTTPTSRPRPAPQHARHHLRGTSAAHPTTPSTPAASTSTTPHPGPEPDKLSNLTTKEMRDASR